MTTPTNEAIPLMCCSCAAKRRAGHAWGYCPHEQVLSVAVMGEAGRLCGWREFGPLTEAEAMAAVEGGLQNALARFLAAAAGGPAQETQTPT